MDKTHSVQKLVYSSLRRIFVGEFARVRKTKAIRKILLQPKQDLQVQNLIKQGYDVDSIIEVAKTLLKEKWFESNEKANAQFFTVPTDSASTSAAKKVPRPKSIASKATATQSVTLKAPSGNKTLRTSMTKIQGTQPISSTQSHTKSQQSSMPDPIRLPFPYQHRIMAEVQSALEKACFTFTQKNANEILQREKWDCAEAIELHRWPKLLLEHQDRLKKSKLANIRSALPSLLPPINQLRHAAVHRLHLPASNTLQLIADAMAFASLLQDHDCLKLISATRKELSVAVKYQERKKHELENRIAEIRKIFAEKRSQLEREEVVQIVSVEKESSEGFFFPNVNMCGEPDTPTEVQKR